MATPQNGGDSVSDDKPARIDGTGGTNPPATETVPQGAPESPRVPGQGPGNGDGGAAQKPDAEAAQGPSLAYDMSAFSPQAPQSAVPPQQPAPPPEDTEGKVRLATVLPVGTFDAGDGLVISQYGTLCTPEQAQDARDKALHAGVRLKEI